jgi:membrane protease YdiL (CAAX protease family)
MSHAFGEEMVFRVLPIVITLRLFRRSIVVALVVELCAAIIFAVWHNTVFAGTLCLGIGASILGVACMKFGAASNKPFQALVACGSIHITCNLTAQLLANIFTF